MKKQMIKSDESKLHLRYIHIYDFVRLVFFTVFFLDLFFLPSHALGKGIVTEIYSANTRISGGGMARRSDQHKTE